jgi:lipid-A-disaccharide synthase
MVGKKLYIIAGEASGDLHGSNLIKALFEKEPTLKIRAWGGDKMQAAGAEVVKHYRDLAFMGFIEVLLHLRTILQNLTFCKDDILAFKPDALVLIDYPGFNMRIAKWAKRKGIPVLYYISPQVWAWKKNRVFTLKKTVDRMFVILPFEKQFYQHYEMDVQYVGHPLLDEISAYRKKAPTRAEFLKKNNLPDIPIIALLPGSRRQEIQNMLPLMAQVIPRFPDYHFVIGGAETIPEELYTPALKHSNVTLIIHQTYDLFNHADAGLITSGTATLEAALFGLPEVVCYKGSAISIAIARRLVDIKFISLVNLIMDREIVKELIQNDLTVKNINIELEKILDPGHRQKLLDDYSLLIELLGGKGASEKVANSVLKTIFQ